MDKNEKFKVKLETDLKIQTELHLSMQSFLLASLTNTQTVAPGTRLVSIPFVEKYTFQERTHSLSRLSMTHLSFLL